MGAVGVLVKLYSAFNHVDLKEFRKDIMIQ